MIATYRKCVGPEAFLESQAWKIDLQAHHLQYRRLRMFDQLDGSDLRGLDEGRSLDCRKGHRLHHVQGHPKNSKIRL